MITKIYFLDVISILTFSFVICYKQEIGFTVLQGAEGSLSSLTWVILVILTCIEDSFVVGQLEVENRTYLLKDSNDF